MSVLSLSYRLAAFLGLFIFLPATSPAVVLSTDAPKELRSQLQEYEAQHRSPEEIQSFLQYSGWYGSSVVYDHNSSPEVLVIDLGCRAVFSQLELKATLDFEDLMPTPGKLFSTPEWESLKSSLIARAQSLGYLQAAYVATSAEVDKETCQVAATLIFHAGRRFVFGDVDFSGVSGISLSHLQKAVNFCPGEVYAPKKLSELTEALHKSALFDTLSVKPKMPSREKNAAVVPIIVTGTARREQSRRVSLGYGSISGVRGQFRWTIPMLTEDGAEVAVGAKMSEVSVLADLRYSTPLRSFTNEWLEASGIYTAGSRNDIREETVSFRPGWRRTTPDASIRLFADIRYDDFEVHGQASRGFFVVPTAEASVTFAKNRLRADSGFQLSGRVLGTSTAVGSAADFIYGQIRGKIIIPIFSQTRLISRGQAGWLETTEFDQLPPAFRFFAGGDLSIRGYDYRELGPEVDGAAVGGRKLLTGSVEVEQFFTDRWSGALFFDTGQAFDEYALADFASSIGVGARWTSKIGQVRVDVAQALDRDQDSSVVLSFGADF